MGMDVQKFGLVFFVSLILLASITFAASPVFTGLTTCSNEVIVAGDRNYYDFPATLQSGVASDADGDLNVTSCEVTFDAGATWITNQAIVDLNSDNNKCQSTVSSGYSDDIQVGFRISDNAYADALTTQKTWWLDNNAPTITYTVTQYDARTTIRLHTTNDNATNTGLGAGFKDCNYKIDSGSWYSNDDDFVLTYDAPPQALGLHTLSYWTRDNFNNSTGTLTLDFNIVNLAAPTVGATTISGFTSVGSNYYGTGTVVGGTTTDIDLNTSSCQYTADGLTWAAATWSTDHCQKTGVTINGNQNYTFGTRIADNSGLIGTGAVLNVHGAMVPSDTGPAIMDTIGQVLYGIASNTALLVSFIILVVVVALIAAIVTDTLGIATKLKDFAKKF